MLRIESHQEGGRIGEDLAGLSGSRGKICPAKSTGYIDLEEACLNLCIPFLRQCYRCDLHTIQCTTARRSYDLAVGTTHSIPFE